jgi:hypothetical protein
MDQEELLIREMEELVDELINELIKDEQPLNAGHE